VLSEVAARIPRRTRDSATPGSDKQLGQFTETTTPSYSQAQAALDAAVAGVVSAVGQLPLPMPDHILAAARDVATWQAAADIELSYPNRDADVQVAAMLQQRAAGTLAVLRQALAQGGQDVGVELFPQWSFPPAASSDMFIPANAADAANAWYGDTDL
jgi:hypothetical protein